MAFRIMHRYARSMDEEELKILMDTVEDYDKNNTGHRNWEQIWQNTGLGHKYTWLQVRQRYWNEMKKKKNAKTSHDSSKSRHQGQRGQAAHVESDEAEKIEPSASVDQSEMIDLISKLFKSLTYCTVFSEELRSYLSSSKEVPVPILETCIKQVFGKKRFRELKYRVLTDTWAERETVIQREMKLVEHRFGKPFKWSNCQQYFVGSKTSENRKSSSSVQNIEENRNLLSDDDDSTPLSPNGKNMSCVNRPRSQEAENREGIQILSTDDDRWSIDSEGESSHEGVEPLKSRHTVNDSAHAKNMAENLDVVLEDMHSSDKQNEDRIYDAWDDSEDEDDSYQRDQHVKSSWHNGQKRRHHENSDSSDSDCETVPTALDVNSSNITTKQNHRTMERSNESWISRGGKAPNRAEKKVTSIERKNETCSSDKQMVETPPAKESAFGFSNSSSMGPSSAQASEPMKRYYRNALNQASCVQNAFLPNGRPYTTWPQPHLPIVWDNNSGLSPLHHCYQGFSAIDKCCDTPSRNRCFRNQVCPAGLSLQCDGSLSPSSHFLAPSFQCYHECSDVKSPDKRSDYHPSPWNVCHQSPPIHPFFNQLEHYRIKNCDQFIECCKRSPTHENKDEFDACKRTPRLHVNQDWRRALNSLEDSTIARLGTMTPDDWRELFDKNKIVTENSGEQLRLDFFTRVLPNQEEFLLKRKIQNLNLSRRTRIAMIAIYHQLKDLSIKGVQHSIASMLQDRILDNGDSLEKWKTTFLGKLSRKNAQYFNTLEMDYRIVQRELQREARQTKY